MLGTCYAWGCAGPSKTPQGSRQETSAADEDARTRGHEDAAAGAASGRARFSDNGRCQRRPSGRAEWGHRPDSPRTRGNRIAWNLGFTMQGEAPEPTPARGRGARAGHQVLPPGPASHPHLHGPSPTDGARAGGEGRVRLNSTPHGRGLSSARGECDLGSGSDSLVWLRAATSPRCSHSTQFLIPAHASPASAGASPSPPNVTGLRSWAC